jgi:hypothetical protein
MSTFKIYASFTETVPAGTAVWFRAQDADLGPALVERYDLIWQVTGPFPGEAMTQAGRQDPADPALFTMDTDGFRPGAYDVTCRRTCKPQPSDPQEPKDAGGTDAGDAPVDLLAAADRSTLTQAVRAETVRGRDEDPDCHDDLAVFRLRVVTPTGSINQDGVVPVSLQRTSTVPTSDQVLWMIIRNRTEAISFSRYKEFIDSVMCGGTAAVRGGREALQFRGTGAFELLCRATDAFLMQEMGVIADGVVTGRARMGATDESPGWLEIEGLTPAQLELRETTRLGFRPSKQQIAEMRKDYFAELRQDGGPVMPYLNTIQARLEEIPLKGPMEVPVNCYGILRSRISDPLSIELLWSYWHEEAMLVQSMYAILARFQNRKLRHGLDPLARLDIDPLRPLGNLIWGWAQEEYSRLTVVRRSAEYEHEYGLRLTGQALQPTLQTVDRRHKFLGSFHNLLFLAHVFFKEDDDTTVIADGFPLLNALRETHLLLAEGAHNQYGDLPSTARAEMMVMEWLLSRPEMREFLGGRVMVPYPEPWMDRVDSLKSMQGWTDVSVTHFRDLGLYGERILLSIRFGNWSDVEEGQQAANWARYWRPEIQRYVHAYRAVTGVDLTSRVDATVPTVLLQRRLVSQRRG